MDWFNLVIGILEVIFALAAVTVVIGIAVLVYRILKIRRMP